MKWIARCLVMLVLFSGCEKVIDIQPGELQPVLVVDGQIENGRPPVILLSNSINFFSTIDPSQFANAFVRNAKVSITDGTLAHQLREYAVPIAGGFNIYYYSIDTAQLNTAVFGQFGKSYLLTIEAGGKQYTSSTTIPLLTKTVDSLWWMAPQRVTDSNNVVVMSRITDPPGYGNYIRYFTKVNNGEFLPGANSAFDDQIVDGTTYDIQVDQGINRNDPPDFEEYGYFKKGDTVTVKFCNTDKATYDFWRTLEFGYQSVGNPFSSPAKVLGNVSNGALGAFCGYAVQYKTLIIPK